MLSVIITAITVGGATMIGVALGFVFKNLPERFSPVMLGFAGGIMSAALTVGFLLPSLDYGGKYDNVITVVGMFVGTAFIDVLSHILPERLPSVTDSARTALMFVLSMAIHNLPEGIAAGVSLGTDDFGTVVSVVGGIALQNFPEGAVVVYPLIRAGFTKRKTAVIALSTGVVEIIGTFIGYATSRVSGVFLPFVLSFAAGTMIYVVITDIASEIRDGGIYAFVTGFAFMLVTDVLL